MTGHERIRDRLDDFVDGALPEEERLEVARHLDGCASCADEVEALRSLLARARELPGELAPERDLWTGIEARIAGVENRGAPLAARPGAFHWLRGILRPKWASAGALAAAILVVAVLLRAPTGPRETAPTVRDGAVAETLVPSLVGALEFQCAGAGKQLASVAEGPFIEGAVAIIGENVRYLDAAIYETKQALEGSPGDPELLRRLTSHYQQKLSLLHEAIRLAQRA